MKRLLSTAGATLLLAAALAVPLVFLRTTARPSEFGAVSPPPDATATIQPSNGPATPESDPSCGSATVSFDAIDATISNRAEGASVVVIATVEAIGEPRWNTPDGKAPAFGEGPPASAYIYRSATLTPDTLAKGNLTEGSLAARVLGGAVGCYSFVFEGSPDLKLGRQYAFFLGPSVASSDAIDPVAFTVNEAWPVKGSTAVTTPLEGEVPVPVFLAEVAKAPPGSVGQ